MVSVTRLLFVFLNVCLSVTFGQQINFKVIRQWKYINYTWPTSESYQTAFLTGSYIPENIVLAGVTYFGSWIYLTMPRMKPGVPATLGRIPADALGDTSPFISPFPTWEFNKVDDCNALQNVQNAEITPDGEIWIIDGGHTHSLTPEPKKNCPAKLVIVNINNNQSTDVHVFPEDVASKTANFLYDLVVDQESNFAYITDNSRDDPGIIVFSRKENQSWKIRHPSSMKADPSAQNFEVNGVPISAPINIAGIALGPKSNNSDREVFYCPLSSLHLYSINTSVLQDKSNHGSNYSGNVTDLGLKVSQSDGMIMSNNGALYYGLLGDNSIARWDSQKSFATDQKILSRDFEYIQWTNSFTIDLEGNLIVLTNTLQRFVSYKTLEVNLTNFWIISASIGEKSYLYGDNHSSEEIEHRINMNANGFQPVEQQNNTILNNTDQMLTTNQTVSVNNVVDVNIMDPSGSDSSMCNVVVVIFLTVLCFSL